MEKDTSESRFTVTNLDDVSAFLGISVRHIQGYFKRGCPGESSEPGKRNGVYRLDLIVQWVRDNVWKSKKSSRLEYLEVKQKNIDVSTSLVKLKKLSGELVERAAVESELKTICNVIRGRLDQIPIELSNSLPAKMRAEFKRDAQNKVNLIKQELADLGKSVDQE